MIVGVCGKSGSGKTYFSNLLEKYGNFRVLHVDDMIHQILETDDFRKVFIERYGKIFLENGKIQRQKLGEYLFSNQETMKSYNQLIWPWIEKLIDKEIECNQNIVIDWMQLPMTKYFQMCDQKILMQSPQKFRQNRVVQRDEISSVYFEKREAYMLEYEQGSFDITLENKGENLDNEAINFLKKIGSFMVGFYAGSFDPFTIGHLNMIKKASYLFDELIVGIGHNFEKKRHYPVSEMEEVIRYTLQRAEIFAKVVSYQGLTLEEARKYHSNYLIRGLRDQTDYQYEEEIAAYNEVHGDIDTLYLRAGKVGNISSTLVRRKLEIGEDVKEFVPEPVYQYLMKKRS